MNTIHDLQSDGERRNHLMKSLINEKVVTLEDFSKSHIESGEFQVFDSIGVNKFIKSLEDGMGEESLEEGQDPEALIEKGLNEIKSLTHQKVEMGDGKLVDFYFRSIPTEGDDK